MNEPYDPWGAPHMPDAQVEFQSDDDRKEFQASSPAPLINSSEFCTKLSPPYQLVIKALPHYSFHIATIARGSRCQMNQTFITEC